MSINLNMYIKTQGLRVVKYDLYAPLVSSRGLEDKVRFQTTSNPQHPFIILFLFIIYDKRANMCGETYLWRRHSSSSASQMKPKYYLDIKAPPVFMLIYLSVVILGNIWGLSCTSGSECGCIFPCKHFSCDPKTRIPLLLVFILIYWRMITN